MKHLLLFTSFLVLPLHAAEDGRISCRMLNFQREGGSLGTVFVADPASGGVIECKVPRDKLSDVVRLPMKERKLEFRLEPGGPPVWVAPVPSSVREALVIFLPAESEKEKFRTVVLDGSEKSYPEGGSLVLNLYSEKIRFILGEHKILLPPGKTATLARPQERDNFNMAGVIFQFESKGGWRSAYESKSRFPEGQRHLYVTYVDPKSRRPRVRTYRD